MLQVTEVGVILSPNFVPLRGVAWKCPACQLDLRHRLAGTASARASASAVTQARRHRLGCRPPSSVGGRTSRRPVRLSHPASSGTASRVCSRAGPPAATALPRFFIDSSPTATPQSPTNRSATAIPAASCGKRLHGKAYGCTTCSSRSPRRPARQSTTRHLRNSSLRLLIDPLGALHSRHPQTPRLAPAVWLLLPIMPVFWPGIESTNSGASPSASTSISLSESTTRPVKNRLSMRGLTPAHRAAAAIVIVLISIYHQSLQRRRRESPRSEDRPPSPQIISAHRLKPASAARRSSSTRNPAPSDIPAP